MIDPQGKRGSCCSAGKQPLASIPEATRNRDFVEADPALQVKLRGLREELEACPVPVQPYSATWNPKPYDRVNRTRGKLDGLDDFGNAARATQPDLASRCALSQVQISYFDAGHRRPTVAQLFRIAWARRLRPEVDRGVGSTGHRIAGDRRRAASAGMLDLLATDVMVPCAFRPAEELIALVVSGEEPDPRLVEAIPADWHGTRSTGPARATASQDIRGLVGDSAGRRTWPLQSTVREGFLAVVENNRWLDSPG